jgi:hypothetical protein
MSLRETADGREEMQKNAVPAESRKPQVRSCVYLISAALSTLLFIFFLATMLMVPGIVPSTKMWMLCVVAVAVTMSLGVGMWQFSSTEAPIMIRPLGPTIAAVLLLELTYCVISVFELAARTHS